MKLPGETHWTDDRDGWRYSESTRPVELAILLTAVLCGWRSVADVEALLTAGLAPRLTQYLAEDWNPADWVRLAMGVSTTVRHPGPGMAYVLLPHLHPDQDEAFVIEKETLKPVTWVTLLYDDDAEDWRIHQVGEAVRPEDLGISPYPRTESDLLTRA